MATHRALAATGKAILRLLEDACPRDDPSFEKARFDFLPAKEGESIIDVGITLSLYRVTVNGARNSVPARPRPDGTRSLPSLPLDLYFLLTPWAETAEQQYRLLGWAMRVLADTPILPAGLLNDVGPENDTFDPEETVEIVLESLSLPDLASIWENLKPKVQLSVSYVARMVNIESKVAMKVEREVQTRVFDLAGRPRP